jgi:hypothetical protein
MKKCRNLNQNVISEPIEAQVKKIINKETKIFTMGSCFAYEIYEYLKEKKYNVLTAQLSDSKPELMWYNTYTMKYELQRIVGKFNQDFDDCWVTNRGYQDPYRRVVFGSSKEDLFQKIETINDVIRAGFTTADVVVITLGLTEVFFQNNNSNAICAVPGYECGGGFDTQVRFTSFQENLENVSEILETLHTLNSKCQVILTVSPVPLGSTFSDNDHVIANMESKSILRAVAAEITRKFDFCHYFHSYEFAMSLNRNEVFIQDARHVDKKFVQIIMNDFEKYFIES